MRILGPPSATWETVRANLADLNPNPLFLSDIAPAVWEAALEYAVDPVGAVAQSAHETGYGRFGRAMQPWHRNTCGLKVRDPRVLEPYGVVGDAHPLAHAQFPSWRIGAVAHVQHLRAYAGCPVPARDVVSPRYEWVIGRYALEHWEEFGGGRWAPASTYGAQVVAIANRLREGAAP